MATGNKHLNLSRATLIWGIHKGQSMFLWRQGTTLLLFCPAHIVSAISGQKAVEKMRI